MWTMWIVSCVSEIRYPLDARPGQHRLAGPGAALDDHDLLVRRRRSLRDRPGAFVDHFLIVDQHEFLIALEHLRQAVHEHLGRADAAVLDLVDQLGLVAVLDVLLDEVAQPGPLGLALEEQRRLLDIGRVPLVVDDVVALVVTTSISRLKESSRNSPLVDW